MHIERVDDKTVKCFLSNEELEEYEIDYKDFVLRSDKAKQMVHDIIEQAMEQVGYKPPKFAFDMQIMMLPDQGLLLTFSESDSVNIPNAQQILEYLNDMRQTLQRTKEQLGIAVNGGAAGEGLAGNIQAADVKDAQANKARIKQAQSARPGHAIFMFGSIRQVMAFAAAIPGNLRVQSTLYEMDDLFYLYLQKGSASYERYSRLCIQALEFGQLYGADEIQLLPMKEHGECLIAEKALQKLRG